MCPPLYPGLLGASWSQLPVVVRRSHLNGTSVQGSGTFRIRHGNTLLAQFLARLLRMPPATEAVEVRLVITPDRFGERWFRTFGDCRLITTQREHTGGLLAERIGMMEFWFRLEVALGGLSYHQTGAALRLGPWCVPLPRWMSPQVEAREEAVAEDGDQTRVQVRVMLPFVGPLLSYEGCIQAEVLSR